MLDGVTITRDAFPRTVRLVTTARLREPALSGLVDNPDDLEALEEIEGATSGRLVAEARGAEALPREELVHNVSHAKFINASFAYAKPGQLCRFNGPDRGAWYSALRVETCMAEVAFHMARALADAGSFNAAIEYGEMFASMAGEFVDLRKSDKHPALDPNPDRGYPVGNALALEARTNDLNGIIYPSIRDPDGTCIVALWPHAVQSVAQGAVLRATWSGRPEPTWSRP